MRRIELLSDQQARTRIVKALDIEARVTAAMPDDLRARVLSNRPSAREVATGNWS